MAPDDKDKKNQTIYKDAEYIQVDSKQIGNKQSQINADDLYTFDESMFKNSELTHINVTNSPSSDLPEYHLSEHQTNALIYYNHATYLLYALSFFTAGLIWVIPIVMNYMRRQEASGTWLATHFDWQIKTFWYSIIAVAIGIVIMLFSIFGLGVGLFNESTNLALGSSAVFFGGMLFVVWAVVWHFYRIVKGWIALSDKRPIQ